MAKKFLLAILALATVFEFVFAFAGFIAPEWTLGQFQLGSNPDTLFLGYVMAWCLLAIAMTCAYSFKLVLNDRAEGHTLARLLGFWWVAIGIAIFLKTGRPDHLIADTLKGALILASSFGAKK